MILSELQNLRAGLAKYTATHLGEDDKQLADVVLNQLDEDIDHLDSKTDL